MLEVLQFVLSGFWIWLGTMFLIGAIGSVVAGAIYAIRNKEDE
jgi:hypothetical protein